MAGIASINQEINAADANGSASWKGENGIRQILLDVTDVLKKRGVLVVNTIADLQALGAADAGLVAVKGIALYCYKPNGLLPIYQPNLVAAGGGTWEYICDLGARSYEQAIGDANETVFTITHNLNTLSPTVLQIDILATPNTYFTGSAVTILNANTIQVTYGSAPAGLQYKIAVKK